MNGDPVQVLLVEDNPADAALLRVALGETTYGRFELKNVKRLDEALARLAEQDFDVVLLDLGLPDSQGLSTFSRMQERAREMPIVVLTGLADEALALLALKAGAQDYLVKGDTASNLMARAIRYAIERKQGEEKLRKSEERFRRYFEFGLIGMSIFSTEKRFLEVNEELCRILGYSHDELLQKTWPELTHPDDVEANLADYERILSGRSDGFTVDKRYVRKDGGVVDAIVSVKCLRNQDGSVNYLIALVQDVTERKAAELAARARESELAHLSRVSMMGQMASGLAHELNQPLAAILNYGTVCVGQIESSRPSSETMRKALAEILHETRRAGAIITRMRSFVRKQQPRRAAVDANELVREAVQLLDFELRHQGVRPRLHLDGSAPQVSADAVQIEQVLVNLIYNALEAMHELAQGKKRLAVSTAVAPDGSSVEISVVDSGPGMSEENLSRLFEPFFTTKSQGLGMGLNISRSIIESHGGRLTATVNPDGGGMRFTFTLPTDEGGA